MNRLIIVIILILGIFKIGICQDKAQSNKDEVFFYLMVDKLPKPILNLDSGEKDIYSYIYSRFKWPNEFSGKGEIIISFIVSSSGNLYQFKVEKGLYSRIENQCIDILKKMPVWLPGEVNNNPVNVRIYLPLEFRLTYDN